MAGSQNKDGLYNKELLTRSLGRLHYTWGNSHSAQFYTYFVKDLVFVAQRHNKTYNRGFYLFPKE